MYPYGYYYNVGYLLLIPAFLFMMFAQFSVNSTFKKYSQIRSSRGMTGADAAEAVLRQSGITNVRIERISGKLTDHFDPRNNVIRLSDNVFSSTSIAAAGVAAHEAGHAVQYANGYTPIKLRNAIIPVTNIGSWLAWPLIFIGLIFTAFQSLALLGVFLFATVVVFQLVTLPVEFNASRRALIALEGGGILYDEELNGARKVLRAAAMTYVAALAVSLAQLLRILIMISGNRRR
ncbi:MAG: zinc metallopeptidase [Clostridiales bacterium]|nr:zinc metallopeptidase [Clostridiales bacterium]